MERGGQIIKPALISKLHSLNCEVLKDEPLSKHSSFKIGGSADYLITIPTKEALRKFFNDCPQEKIFILGGGTNILFSDDGFRGIIIKLTGEFKNFSFDKNFLICGATVSLPLIVSESINRDFLGLEFCAGIPGTAGGAVFGNAGTKEGSISESVKSVEIFENGNFRVFGIEKINFSYRQTSIKGIICEIIFSLKNSGENDILKTLKLSLDRRKKTQPLDSFSAGCIFKNPPNFSAGKLIDECGLKGKSIGGAQISQLHANFIINKGMAKSADILALIDIARNEVKKKFGIDLETEIKIVK